MTEYVRKRAREQYEKGVIGDAVLDPGKTAIIVIDLIEEFTKPNWTPFWVPEATEMLPRIKRLLDVSRSWE